MDLRARLATLQRQAGQTTSGPVLESGRDLAERLGRMRPRNAAAPLRSRLAPEQFAHAMGGQVVADGLIRIERRLPLDGRHGSFELARLRGGAELLPEARVYDPRHLLFLDTETSGLAGGTGTLVFLLGLARLEGEALVVRQYQLSAFAGERALLEAAAEWLEAASALVTFNGKCFDVPLLATRCRLAGVHDRFSALEHVDLLYPTRRAFRSRWQDCRLATAENRLLGFRRSGDLPGSEAPEAWFRLVHRGDMSLLPRVAEHNFHDLVSLAALLPALDGAHAAPAEQGADRLAIARGWLLRGEEDRALALLRENGLTLSAEGRLVLARLHRQRGEWPAALVLWEALAAEGVGEACERLAKYHEHQRRDYSKALAWARRLPPGPAAQQRIRRLEARVAARVGTGGAPPRPPAPGSGSA